MESKDLAVQTRKSLEVNVLFAPGDSLDCLGAEIYYWQ